MKIGFPLVQLNQVHLVWVNVIRSDEQTGKARWSQIPLQNAPFVGDVLNRSLRELLEMGLDVRFESRRLPKPPFDSEGKIEADGSSGEMCLGFLKFYATDKREENISILLTGRLDNGIPAPLGNEEQLRLKFKAAQAASCWLFMAPDDAKQLQGDPELAKYYYRIPDYKELEWGTLSKEIDREDNTFFASVTNVQDWYRILGELLGMLPRKITPSGSAPVEERLPLRTAKPESAPPAPTPDAGTPTFASLLEAAIPSGICSHDQELRHQILGKNNSFQDFLFEDGLAWQAMNQKDRIFFHPQPNLNPLRRHIIFGGPTGTGKTRVARMLLLNTLAARRSAIYVAPTRMLVYEVYEDFKRMLPDPGDTGRVIGLDIDPDREIVISTGERNEHDSQITSGQFRLAFIVYEKANLFLNLLAGNTEDPRAPFANLSMIVIDEIHMLSDSNRGGVLDMFLTKALREADKRANRPSNNYPLRVVAITTEQEKDEALNKVFSLVSRRLKPEESEPVLISAAQRPLPVTHIIQPWEEGSKIDPVVIGDFALQTDRQIPHLERNQIEDKLRRAYDQRKHEYGTNTSEIAVIRRHLAESSKAIVASASVYKLITDLGEDLYRNRPVGGEIPAGEIDRRLQAEMPVGERDRLLKMKELDGLLARVDIPEANATRLRKMAWRNIFLHYSVLDYEIRKWMATAFRDSVPFENHPCILLATETVTYGVNLPADCIILVDLNWPRVDPIRNVTTHAPLTPNQYHNLLGRVGRAGCSRNDHAQKAIVMHRAAEPAHTIVNMYAQLPTCEAATFAITDLERLFEDTIETLSSVSYSAFRSILDATRYAATENGGSASIKEITALLKRSFFWKFYAAMEEEALKRFITLVLDLAHDYLALELSRDSQEGPRLVKKGSRGTGLDKVITTYSVSEHGAALIDTGTNWQAIPPLRDWLDQVRKFHKDAGADIPVELLIPGMVATPDLWMQMRTFCEEFNILSPYEVEESREWSRSCLREEVERLFNGHDAASTKVQQALEMVESFADASRLVLNEKRPDLNEYSAGVFLRLVAALLKWVRGADADVMEGLHYAQRPRNVVADRESKSPVVRDFSPRFHQRASWLAHMCLRFFGNLYILLPEHWRELPMLALRLRHGIPAEGIPFLKSGGGPSRREVMKILEAGVSVCDIISRPNLIEYISDRALSYKRPADLVDNVFRYYANGARDLCNTFGQRQDPSRLDAWSHIRNLISRLLLEQRGTGSGLPAVSSEFLGELESILVQLARDDKRRISAKSLGSVARGLNILKGVEMVRMLLLGPLEEPRYSPDGQQPLLVRVPWPTRAQADGAEVTLFGALCLIYLCSREFVKFPALIDWTRHVQGAAPRLYSIKDFIESIEGIRGHILPEILEKLLVFDEPSVGPHN